jgi:hypothetical protein
MARKILILAAALALGLEALGAVFVAIAFYGFVSFGNGVAYAGASPGQLQAVAVVLNVGLAALYAVGCLIMLLAAFGTALNRPMQGVMMGIAALQLFLTIVVTGLTGWMQLFVLGSVFVLLAGALAVTAVTADAPKPEPGPVDPAPGNGGGAKSGPTQAPAVQ